MEDEPTPQEVVGISLNSTDGEIVLHWFNCQMRLFKDEQFNHVEWRDDEDRLRGLRVGQAVMDLLFEHDFPYQFDPIVDEATKEWFVQSEMTILQRELDDM